MAATTSHQAVNKLRSQPSNPLRILIVGAGIGGLSAGVALRQQGHHVDIFERSRLAQETGAAIHLGPNCNGLLRRLGLFVENIGAVECETVTEYDPQSGALKYSIDTGATGRKLWAHPWHLVHRAHLHTALKAMAIASNGIGEACALQTSSCVASVDAIRGVVTLEDGTELHGDVIIGADGVHSATRKAISGGDLLPYDSGKSAFRFLLPTDLLRNDPKTSSYVEKRGELIMWIAGDRRLVMYPCADSTLMNFVAIHPSKESAGDITGEGWQETGSKSRMLQIYSKFNPSVLAILEKADESKLKVWKLLDMEKMPSFTAGRLAVLGDAAHPFLPHQGQGGGQAIEDAVSLAALLPMGTSPNDVAERLQLYERCRYERAHKIQEFTRSAGKDKEELAAEGKQLDMMEYINYNFGWDEWDASRHTLAKHLEAKDTAARFRTPSGFGASPGPRRPLGQATASTSIGALRETTPERFITYTIKLRSSRTFLQQLLPPRFAFTSPGTLAFASIVCTTLDGMTWLAGGGYSHFGLYIHGVNYTRKDGTKVFGTYLPVLFENLADPIVTGRAELGMPKLFADIDIQEDEKDKDTVIRLSWRGAHFAEVRLSNLMIKEPNNEACHPQELQAAPAPGPPPPPPEQGLLLHRYVPAVGEPGKADADYAVLCPYPRPLEPTELLASKDATVSFEAKDWQSLPTLHHITKVLAEMPIYGVEDVSMKKGEGVDDLGTAQRID